MNDKTTTGSNSASSPMDNDERQLFALDSPEGQECLKEFFSAQFELNHDLNNPLAGVVGYLELALTGKESIPERPKELLLNVQKCANRMDELIQEFVKSKRRLQEAVDLSDVICED